MITRRAQPSIVILTEDSGKDGRATIEAIVRRMLHLVVPGYGSHRIDFVPRDPDEEAAMRGNVWKADGKNPVERERRVRLLRYIARKLCLPGTFVMFHIDGDRTWSERHTGENVAKFERLIRGALPQIVDRGRANVSRSRALAASSGELPVLQLDNLVLVCPYRSIEAWLYQNLAVAVDICNREHEGAHVTGLRSWEARRDELDELSAPERELCVGKAFNLELATRGFPAREAYDVKMSYAETVDRLLALSALSRALELTRS